MYALCVVCIPSYPAVDTETWPRAHRNTGTVFPPAAMSGPPWGGIALFLAASVLNRVRHWEEKMAKLGHKPHHV